MTPGTVAVRLRKTLITRTQSLKINISTCRPDGVVQGPYCNYARNCYPEIPPLPRLPHPAPTRHMLHTEAYTTDRNITRHFQHLAEDILAKSKRTNNKICYPQIYPTAPLQNTFLAFRFIFNFVHVFFFLCISTKVSSSKCVSFLTSCCVERHFIQTKKTLHIIFSYYSIYSGPGSWEWR